MSYSQLYSQYIYIKSTPNASGEVYGRCPFHEDKNPSLSFNDETGVWYCFTCDEGGTPEYFIQQVEDVDYPTAQQIVREKMGKPTLPSNEKIRHWQEALDEAPSVIGYLKRRGITSEELLTDYEIGWDGERIIIPIRNEKGELTNLRRLAIGGDGPKVKNWPGFGECKLWPIDQLDNDTILLCAGETDTLSALQQGYNAVTGTSGETGWRKEFNSLFSDKDVYIVYDGDQVGRQCAQDRAVDLSGHAKTVYVAHLPDGKDVNDIHQEGKDLKPYLDEAILVGTPGPRLVTGPELLQEIEARERQSWLIEKFMRLGWLGVLGGHAKGGKTTIVTHLMRMIKNQEDFLGFQINESVPCMYVSYEMDDEDIAGMYSDIISEDPNEWPFILLDPPRPLEPDDLKPFLDLEPGVCFIDSATPAFALRGEAENQSSEIGYYLRGLQDLARRTGWTIIVIHHLTKRASGNSILDLRGAGEWTAAPDLLMIWSDSSQDDKPGEMLVEGRIPNTGTYDVLLDWDVLEMEGETAERIMSETAKSIDDLLIEEPGLTCKEIQTKLDLSKSAVWKSLTTEKFFRRGEGRRGNPYLWYSPDNSPKKGRDY